MNDISGLEIIIYFFLTIDNPEAVSNSPGFVNKKYVQDSSNSFHDFQTRLNL